MSSFSDFLLPIVQKVNMYLSDYFNVNTTKTPASMR